MDYRSFLRNQEEIYNKFRAASNEVRMQGTLPDPAAVQRATGLMVALRHPLAIGRAVENLSLDVATRIWSVVYGVHNVHTTISDYGLAPHNNISPDDSKTKESLERLARGVGKALNGLCSITVQDCRVLYHSWLINRTTVVAAGTPTPEWLELVEAVEDSCQNEGVNLRRPWGAHITTCRFLQEVRPEDLAAVLQLVDVTLPLGESRPASIDVGYLSYNQGMELAFNVFACFPL